MRLRRGFLFIFAAMGARGVPADPKLVHIPLARSLERSLIGPDGFVDRFKLHVEINTISSKYQRTLNNYLANTGSRYAADGRARMVRRATGIVPLASQSSMLWTGPMQVGTPPQTIQIDFDTGSADTIVNPGAYTPDKSSSSSMTNSTFQSLYGDGTQAQGNVYTDVLEIGGLTAGKAYIGRARQDFIKNEGSSQGIAGMGFPVLSTFQGAQKPWFYALAEAGVLDNKAFVFKLHKSMSSSLTLGATNSDATYSPVTDAAYWSIQGDINNEPIAAIIDSGTSAIMAPAASAESFFKSLNLKYQESHGFLEATYDCASAPNVNLTFGQKVIRLVRNLGTEAWILGDPLFNAAGPAGITFDVANERVGF